MAFQPNPTPTGAKFRESAPYCVRIYFRDSNKRTMYGRDKNRTSGESSDELALKRLLNAIDGEFAGTTKTVLVYALPEDKLVAKKVWNDWVTVND